MSGIELIVGAVLGAIPIALETYDRSGRVFEVFSSFRQYPREVLILETKLGAQRTIFRSNAVNLLTAITKNRVQVQGVLDQPSSHAARLGLVMSPLYLRRLDTLDEAFVSCRQTAERINEALQRLCSQAEAFRAEVGEKQDVSCCGGSPRSLCQAIPGQARTFNPSSVANKQRILYRRQARRSG